MASALEQCATNLLPPSAQHLRQRSNSHTVDNTEAAGMLIVLLLELEAHFASKQVFSGRLTSL